MGQESPKLNIPEKIVDQVEERFSVYEDIGEYVRDTNLTMMKKQSALYSFIRERSKSVADFVLYGTGATVTFDAIDSWLQQEGLEMIITEEDLDVYRENISDFWEDERWNDLEWAKQQLEAGNQPTTNFPLEEKLAFLSPALLSLLGVITNGLSTLEEKENFLRGVMDVSVPFISKVEARVLNEGLGNPF